MKGFPKPNLFKIYMIGYGYTWKRKEKNMQRMLRKGGRKGLSVGALKERFPHLRKSKLIPRGDRPFKIMKKLNDNAYKVDMPQEFGRSMQAPNLRTNSLLEGENDANTYLLNLGDMKEEAVLTPQGFMTRDRLKKCKKCTKNCLNQASMEFPSIFGIPHEGKQRENMGENNEGLESYSLKSKQVMNYMMRLEERFERLGSEHKEGLDVVRRDTQSVDTKVEALNGEKEE
ncbi:hypothetical protein CR513_05303, partial [Mucuna pruriens]